ncbi:MAG: winged helix-turn-helix domain-containing protein [Rhodospirillaceae bacterium]
MTVGDLVLFPQRGRAHWRGREVGLTVTEFNIVLLMASSPGADFTYREIYDVVHGEGFFAGDGDEGVRVNVRSLIRRIRKKFKETGDSFNAIENYPAFGYRWISGTGSRNPPRSALLLSPERGGLEP